MRMLLKVGLPVERANEKIADGSLPKLLPTLLADLKPEAAYFLTFEGKRTMLLFIDLADLSQIPVVAEPFFMALNAEVDFYPVMNAEDLGKGMAAVPDAVRKYA